MPRATINETIAPAGDILARLTHYECVTVTLSAAAVTADEHGKKLLPAGTLLGSAMAGKKILSGGAAAKPDNTEAAEGVLFEAADLSGGDVEAAMLYVGTVSLERMPEAPVYPEAMPRITFLAK